MNTVEQMRSMTDEERKLHEEGLNRLFKPTGRNLHDLGSVQIEVNEPLKNCAFCNGNGKFKSVNGTWYRCYCVKEEPCDSITK